MIWVGGEENFFENRSGRTGKSVDGPFQKSQLSGDFQRPNVLDILSELLLRLMQVVPLLQIEPKVWTVSAQPPFIVGSARFKKISAVEGIKFTPEMKGRTALSKRKDVTAEERRKTIIREYFLK